MRRLSIFCFLFAVSVSAASGQSNCTIDLPVGVLGTDYSLLTGLTPTDLTVRVGKQQRPIIAVNYDAGPRRIVFVVDDSQDLAPDAHKAEVKLIEHILSSARPEDSFALLTARGAPHDAGFVTGRDAVLKAANGILADPRQKDKGRGVLDALMQAINWFGEPQRGDAIFTMAASLEEKPDDGRSGFINEQGRLVAIDQGPKAGPISKISVKVLYQALYQHRIRVFGIDLGTFPLMNPGNPGSMGLALDESAVYSSGFPPLFVNGPSAPSENNLFELSYFTGGFAIWENTQNPRHVYELTNDRLKKLEHKVLQAYGAITRFYLLRVQAPDIPGTRWELKLPKDLEKNTRLVYPREFSLCAEANSAGMK